MFTLFPRWQFVTHRSVHMVPTYMYNLYMKIRSLSLSLSLPLSLLPSSFSLNVPEKMCIAQKQTLKEKRLMKAFHLTLHRYCWYMCVGTCVCDTHTHSHT